jgi:hypothetical protein
MTSSLSATSNVRATSPSSVSCTSLATTLDIFAFVHRGVGYRLDDAAVNGALSPRALPKSLCETKGEQAFPFGITKFDHAIRGNLRLLALL